VESDKCFVLNAAEEEAGWGEKTGGKTQKPFTTEDTKGHRGNLKSMRNENRPLKSRANLE
jgi:hypothetical protein